MFCPQCGKKIEDTSKFCGKCGAPLPSIKMGNEDKASHQKTPVRKIILPVLALLFLATLGVSGYLYFSGQWNYLSKKLMSARPPAFETVAPAPMSPQEGKQYFPMKVGSRWVYDYGDMTRIRTVDSEIMFNGKYYYKIITEMQPLVAPRWSLGTSFLRVDKNGLYRLLDSTQPDKGEILITTFPFIAGASGSYIVKDNTVVKWKVEPGGTVSVSGKQYNNCLKMTTDITHANGDTTVISYLAPNVGTIKERTFSKRPHKGELPSEGVLIEYTP